MGRLADITPQLIKDSEDYQILLTLAEGEVDSLFSLVSKFSELIDLDKVPAQFLKAYGEQLGLPHNPNKSLEAYRQAIKIIHSVMQKRGTVRVIKELGRLNHILSLSIDAEGDIVITPFEWDYYYRISYPATEVFRVSVSPLSGKHHFQNYGYYREGVIVVETTARVRNIIRPYVEYARPAGVKIFWAIYNASTLDSIYNFIESRDIAVLFEHTQEAI